ncbi:MAG TPA: hypothetical protein VKB75_01880, partial [Jatrophihabitans sp.]|nr:hypothetical protein [Jatrophihabitans sp.]
MIGSTPRARGRAVVARRGLLASAVTAAAASTLVACGGGACSTAPTPADGDGTHLGTVGLAIVGIITADINRSLRFYKHLGLDVPADAAGDSYRLRTADGHVLFWESQAAIHAFDPGWSPPPPGDRRVVLEFGFSNPANLEATYRRLIGNGAPSHLAPFDQGGG